MVFHCFDHDLMLQFRTGHLHPTSATDGRMGNISISGDFVGGVDNHYPFIEIVG